MQRMYNKLDFKINSVIVLKNGCDTRQIQFEKKEVQNLINRPVQFDSIGLDKGMRIS